MNTDRPCGCKSFRSCYICEKEFGIPSSEEGAQLVQDYEKTFVFCPERERLFPVPKDDSSSFLSSFINPDHSRHENGTKDPGITFPGVKIIRDFITQEEETQLIKDLDDLPWDSSQSGRRKQNFGPRANFKKRKTKAGAFAGFPAVTKFVQDRFATVDSLKDYRTVEQCSIEYQPETGSCIEPHIDDCWIWGERIVQLNMLADSFLTCVPYKGSKSRYNLQDVAAYPKILDDEGNVMFNAFDDSKNSQKPYAVKESTEVSVDAVIKIPLPRRSLLVFFDEPRYDWQHCILREDVPHRRVVIAYREFTPPYLPGGSDEEVGKDILEKAAQFWSS